MDCKSGSIHVRRRQVLCPSQTVRVQAKFGKLLWEVVSESVRGTSFIMRPRTGARDLRLDGDLPQWGVVVPVQKAGLGVLLCSRRPLWSSGKLKRGISAKYKPKGLPYLVFSTKKPLSKKVSFLSFVALSSRENRHGDLGVGTQ